MIDITAFGAVGDGKTMNTAAIQAAVDKAAKSGSMVNIPAGVFLTGTIVLNGASLHLESGAGFLLRAQLFVEPIYLGVALGEAFFEPVHLAAFVFVFGGHDAGQ